MYCFSHVFQIFESAVRCLIVVKDCFVKVFTKAYKTNIFVLALHFIK